jgi:anti-sigma factor RsiW
MFRSHVSRARAAFVDGELPSVTAANVSAHLTGCHRCRVAVDQHQFAAGLMRDLAVAEAPASIWTSIEAALSNRGADFGAERIDVATRHFRAYVWLRPLTVAALLTIAISGILFWFSSRSAPHDVVRLDSAFRPGRVSIGEWIETDAVSRARIRIGEIGTVDVAPNTRMQVLAARPDEHRLNLARGAISAEILAPPRLFFVETPSSTVVDLGCAYTMEVDEAGNGQLRVTSGWASLESGTLESLVPAGASCPTRPGVGPGTPSFDDASERLRQALIAFDYEGGGAQAVDIVLAEARPRDTLTLWHLLFRVAQNDRERVFDRMAALTPLPTGVTRDKALALDLATMTLWREELAWTW